MADREPTTGIVLTKNEENNIAEVLQCLSFCDEIIVMDAYSSDKTVAIAETFPKVKIHQRHFEDFTKQRNEALKLASSDWILMLDADERITQKLQQEILTELSKPNKKDAYYFYRKFFFEGKPIHFSGTQSDKNFRLFRKSKCRYSAQKKVHETLEVNGETGILKNKLLHYSVKTVGEYRKKMLQYSMLKAEELHHKGKKFTYLAQFGKAGFGFFRDFVLRLGFLDGRNGLKLCALHSFYIFETYSFMKKMQKKVSLFTMKITVISFDFWGYDAHIVEALGRLGITATHINIGKYRHKNLGAKLQNAISKIFFGKNLKNELRQQQMMVELENLGTQDKILVINPELIDEKYHQKIQKFTKKYIAYLYDSLARCPAEHLLGYFNEVFSFDEADCKKHGFSFITNYNYLPEIEEITAPKYDVVGISSYDARLKKAEKIASKLQDLGLNFHFKIIGKKAWAKRLRSKKPGFFYSSKRIPHAQLSIFYQSGKAILDLARENQTGLSFRVFEAMALKKKIITDNQSIRKYDFYNPQNILVLDEHSELNPEFFKTEYEELPAEIYKKYTVDNWVKRVFAI